MLIATSSFETQNASRYIAQLCKHFAHKVEVDYSEMRGGAALPPGPAVMEARDGALHFDVRAETEEGLMRAKFIIEDHIKRFAFRENLSNLNWSR